MSSLINVLTNRGGDLPIDMIGGLADLVSTMEAMAQGTASPSFFLSSLDPGMGKTTALIHFVRQVLRSPHHQGVSVLVCLPSLGEIRRLVEEMMLQASDFAVYTSDDEMNALSNTPSQQARVLFTTHEMVRRKCRDRSFSDQDAFHYRGHAREVRLWDETVLPGEEVSLSTDELASLREPLRTAQPALATLVEQLELSLKSSSLKERFSMPDIKAETNVSLWSAQEDMDRKTRSILQTLYWFSGRTVFLRKHNPASPVISALDTRDVLPSDLAPMVILDASGRVRTTYDLWKKHLGNLIRLQEVSKRYGSLTIRFMEKGAAKSSWNQNGNDLAREVAAIINTKPDEPWLVIYLKGACGGTVPDMVRGLIDTDPDRVHFLNWGKHQGTNDFRDISNVILAGTQFYSEAQYEMMARYCTNLPKDQEVSQAVIDQVKTGEHSNHILQALCRSSVRKSNGTSCSPCNAYIIASKASGIRGLLPTIFPGCKVKPWRPAKKKLRGQVGMAVAYVESFFAENPDGVLHLRELRRELEITNASNFNRRVRNHPDFKTALEEMQVEEVSMGAAKYPNALAKIAPAFSPIPGSNYIADV